jgi:hypothetical protein
MRVTTVHAALIYGMSPMPFIPVRVSIGRSWRTPLLKTGARSFSA